MSAEASQLAAQAVETEEVGLLDQIVEKSKVAKSKTEHDRAKDIIAALAKRKSSTAPWWSPTTST